MLGAHGHDLLGQHIERIAWDAGGLDRPVEHAPHDHRGFEQIASVFGEELSGADRVHRVAGAADALQAAGDRGG